MIIQTSEEHSKNIGFVTPSILYILSYFYDM